MILSMQGVTIFYSNDPFCESTKQQNPRILEHWILMKPLYLIKGKKLFYFIKNLNLYIILILHFIGEKKNDYTTELSAQYRLQLKTFRYTHILNSKYNMFSNQRIKTLIKIN